MAETKTPKKPPHRLGQYVMVTHAKTFRVGKVTLTVAVSGAYDAMGLIGPECNGIVVLQESPEPCVLLDEHCPHPGGSGYYGPHATTVAEFERLCRLKGRALAAFVRGHPRSRHPAFDPYA